MVHAAIYARSLTVEPPDSYPWQHNAAVNYYWALTLDAQLASDGAAFPAPAPSYDSRYDSRYDSSGDDSGSPNP